MPDLDWLLVCCVVIFSHERFWNILVNRRYDHHKGTREKRRHGICAYACKERRGSCSILRFPHFQPHTSRQASFVITPPSTCYLTTSTTASYFLTSISQLHHNGSEENNFIIDARHNSITHNILYIPSFSC